MDVNINSVKDILTRRTEKLETAFYFGANPSAKNVQGSLTDRLLEVDIKIQKIEKEIPAQKACEDLIATLKPLISEQRAVIQTTNEKVDQLLCNKQQIVEYVENLAAIGRMSGAINSPHFAGMIS